jgi:predicted PurR-regulated permease PerM
MSEKNLKLSRIILWTLAAVIGFYLLYLISDIIVIIIISILIAFIFEPFVKQLEKEGFNRLTSTVFIFVSVSIIIYIIISVFVPAFIYQMHQLIAALNLNTLEKHINIIENEIDRIFPFLNPGEISAGINNFIKSWVSNPIDKVSALLTSIFSVLAFGIIVPFIVFFLLKDSKKIFKGILNIMPNKYFEMSYWILKKVSIQLGRFVRAWVFDATFVGLCCGVGFSLIGVKYALPLGLIAGIGHLVPYLGPVFGGIPAIIISIAQYGDLSRVPVIILLLILVYILDNGLVQPFVFSKGTNMHPIIIILLIIVGGQLFGIVGMLIAVPTATVVKTATKEIYFALKNYKIAKS